MVTEGSLGGLKVAEMTEEDFMGWPDVRNHNLPEKSFLNLADRMSKHGTVKLEVFSGVSVIGRSLGIKADRDFEDEELGYDVIGFKSSYTAKVYAIPEWLVSGVSMY